MFHKHCDRFLLLKDRRLNTKLLHLKRGAITTNTCQQYRTAKSTAGRSATTRRRALPNKMNQDLNVLSHAELIDRCASLEHQLRAQTARVAELTRTAQCSNTTPSETHNGKPVKQFDAGRRATRFIALKLSYLGQRYNGFEHANRCFTPLPTIEEVLWKALRKARLINPPVPEGADSSYEVVHDPKERERKYFVYGKTNPEQERNKVRLEVSWEGCQYSKCGRTDRGVSAFGQVIGIRVRSNAPPMHQNPVSDEVETRSDSLGLDSQDEGAIGSEEQAVRFDPVKDELPYVYMLNMLLPPDIRVLAWCPFPPEGFDARYSCLERRYRYFFTNPAFCPTPGPLGLVLANGNPAPVREGWLDIGRMREAAKKLVGLHDYRNLCQIDASKQMPSCERRITFADIQEVDSTPTIIAADQDLNALGEAEPSVRDVESSPGPKVFAIIVHGTAFLWHQVRCIAAILFLVGQGLESPDVVDKLLDIQQTPGRPHYTMADDAPLVLWDCIFPAGGENGAGSLEWIYAGDQATVPALTSKGDGKWGLGGVVDELWAQWRDVKIKEAQINGLLTLAMSTGDSSSIERGGLRDPRSVKARSQKVFEGAGRARLAGRYTPLMNRRQMDTLDVLNAKYLATTKGTRRFLHKLSPGTRD